jgi:hypothetical protein
LVLRLEQAKSLIVTNDRDFKTIVRNMLNGIGFPAEKLYASSWTSAANLIPEDKFLVNIVVDFRAPDPDDVLEKYCEQICEIFEKTKAKLLIYTTENAASFISENLSKWVDCNRLAVEFDPVVQKQHFPGLFQEIGAGSRSKTPKGSQGKSEAIANLPFVEASQHVRETIQLLNNLSKEGEIIAEVVAIGQRFNGFIGAFAFFEEKKGFRELMALAKMIDSVSKHYEKIQEGGKISIEHKNFMIQCCKCALFVLKDLRETGAIGKPSLEAYSAIPEEFQKLTDIKVRSETSQDQIDAWLDELDGGEEAS